MMHNEDGVSRAALSRLRQVGRAVRLFSAVAAALMVLGIVWVWSDGAQMVSYARGVAGATAAPAALSPGAYWTSLGLGLIPAAVFVHAMMRLAALFGRFAKGNVLESENAVALGRIGWLLIGFGVLSPIARALQSVAFTLGNPVGQRQLAVQLDPGVFGALAAGATLVAFGLVLREAIRLDEENKSFV